MNYAQRFSWDGKRHELRPLEKRKIIYRRKRSVSSKSELKNALLPKDEIFINVQKISVIDEYLVGSPRIPFEFPRRLFMINIMNTEESNFDDLTRKLLEKLWNDYALGNVVIVTLCSNKPEVSRKQYYLHFIMRIIPKCFYFFYYIIKFWYIFWKVSERSKIWNIVF